MNLDKSLQGDRIDMLKNQEYKIIFSGNMVA